MPQSNLWYLLAVSQEIPFPLFTDLYTLIYNPLTLSPNCGPFRLGRTVLNCEESTGSEDVGGLRPSRLKVNHFTS